MPSPRTLRLLVLTIVGLALLPVPVVALATPASACSCSEDPDVQVSYDASDVVVSGSMAAQDVAADGESAVHEVAVTSVHQGEASATLRYRTPGDGASCGYEPQVGTEVLVFLRAGERGLSTTICAGNRTGPLAPEDRAVVDGWPAAAPQPDAAATDPPLVAWAAVVVGGSGLVVLAVLALARLRRQQRPRP